MGGEKAKRHVIHVGGFDMAHLFLYIILGVLLSGFLLERVLDYLNSTLWSDKLPRELAGICDEEKYQNSQNYERVNQRFSLLTESLSFVLLILVLLFGGFAWLDDLARSFVQGQVVRALFFFGCIALVSSILGIPFEIYRVFRIEEKFGFNRTTWSTFILDKLKGALLGAVIGGGLLALVITVYLHTGDYFWILIWAILSVFMIAISMFYSDIIVPLFNRQTELEPGELRDAIEHFIRKAGFRIKNIYLIDGSKRSTKANAYFSGLGPKKRIVLYDTLLDGHTVPQIVAILAHEVGHFRKKHILIGIAASIFQTGLMLYILSFFIRPGSAISASLCGSLGGLFPGLPVEPGFHTGILAFGLLYSPLSTVLGIAGNLLSRKHEYQADRFASLNYASEPLCDALIKLSVDHLSNLRPHPLYVFVHYSHPPLLQRLKALKYHCSELSDHDRAGSEVPFSDHPEDYADHHGRIS